jgi:hypothetical protein
LYQALRLKHMWNIRPFWFDSTCAEMDAVKRGIRYRYEDLEDPFSPAKGQQEYPALSHPKTLEDCQNRASTVLHNILTLATFLQKPRRCVC